MTRKAHRFDQLPPRKDSGPPYGSTIFVQICSRGFGSLVRSLIRRLAFPACALWLVTAPPGCAAVGSTSDSARLGQSRAGALDIDPARAYTRLSEIEPAVTRPARPDSLKPLSKRASRQISKASRLVGEQRYTEAAIELERALRYDPDHPQIHRTLAMLHWQAGNIERTRIHAGRALEENSDDAVAHYLKGRCHALDEDQAMAITEYRIALLCSDFDRDLEIAVLCHYELARALHAEGYLGASLAQYIAFEDKVAGLGGTVAQPELVTLLASKRG